MRTPRGRAAHEEYAMLMPRKVAHRKHHRGRTKGIAKGGTGELR